jgi:dienelactone hydrolase
MEELWILEFIVLLFLFLSLSRPLIKGLWPLEGLVWLPLLSLAITLGLYPAYGFRPETLPLVFFEFLLIFFNLPAMSASLTLRPSDAFRDRSPVLTVTALLLCAAAGFFALAFSPKISQTPAGEVQALAVRDEDRDRDYFLRIYRPLDPGPGLPLLFVIPPEAGSAASIDQVCAGLRDRGFTVITYSRRGFDVPALGEGGRKYHGSPARIYRQWSAFHGGFTFKTANDRGRSLEAARMEDIEFLLPQIIRRRGAGTLPLVMAGYGAGGTALVRLADSPPGVVPWDGQVLGIAAVESGLWGLYRAEHEPRPAAPAEMKRFWERIPAWFAGLKPQRISGLDPLPRPGIPALYLVSDRIQEKRPGKDPYEALRGTLRASLQPAALVYLAGAGPLDYTDHPRINPVYSALLPGWGKKELAAQELVNATSAIIGNFALLLAGALPDSGPPAGTPIPGLHIETRSWNLPDLRYILTW